MEQIINQTLLSVWVPGEIHEDSDLSAKPKKP